MRGSDSHQARAFSYIGLEERIPEDHPIRAIRKLVDRILRKMSGDFEAMYSRRGRPSIAPERLIRALILQLLYGIRSERQLMERMDYDLLFRWFVGLEIDDPVWNASTFSKNRERLTDSSVTQKFLGKVVQEARRRELLSDEHFTVDGTLLEAWASFRSLRPKDEDPPQGGVSHWGEFKGQKRSNKTHESKTDPDARLCRKSKHKEVKLGYAGHVLMDNRARFVVGACATMTDGYAEREAAKQLMRRAKRRGKPTLAADKGYDAREMHQAMRDLGVEAHIAQKTPHQTSVPKQLTKTTRYKKSQACRKHIEQVFGWIKAPGRLEKLHHRGRDLVDSVFVLAAATYDVVRLAKLEQDVG